MCGILGIVSPAGALPVTVETAREALFSLAHRGPDGWGELTLPEAYLGHVRLAIIDVEGGAQPMTNASGRYTVVFNGQIFNYLELRAELESRGSRFTTRSDTEVLLEAYETWGRDCLRRLNGMFAFAILDRETGELFAARDRFGIKPFYYAEHDGALAFASEPKAIQLLGLMPVEPEPRHFNEYLIFGYVAGSETLLKGILELEPGHFLLFGPTGSRTGRYAVPWEGAERFAELGEDEARNELEEQLERAVALWVRGDVGVGSLLSSGLDSPLVTSLATRTRPGLLSFTAVLPRDPDLDEGAAAERLARGMGSVFVPIPLEDDYLEHNLLELTAHVNEPLHDSNAFTMLALCDGIRERTDLKVLLCGEGSDELFGGYERHRTVSEEYAATGDPDVLVYARNVLSLPRLALFTDDVSISNGTRHELLDEILQTPAGREPLNAVLLLDQATFLGAYLHRHDRVGMRRGLEVRPPFLDHEFTAFVNSLPADFKIRDGWQKWLLRGVAERHLPSDLVWRREKFQFAAPVLRLFDGSLGELAREMLGPDCELSSWYSVEGIRRLFDDHRPEAGRDHSNTLWRLLSLEFWLRALRGVAVPTAR